MITLIGNDGAVVSDCDAVDCGPRQHYLRCYWTASVPTLTLQSLDKPNDRCDLPEEPPQILTVCLPNPTLVIAPLMTVLLLMTLDVNLEQCRLLTNGIDERVGQRNGVPKPRQQRRYDAQKEDGWRNLVGGR